MTPNKMNDQDHPARDEAGYTLAELLVVLAVLTLILSIVTPQIFNYLGRAKSRTAKIQIEALASNMDFFRLDVGRFPSADEGLVALVDNPDGLDSWAGPYINKRSGLIDPWGNPYQYRLDESGDRVEIYTFGSDNKEGGEGEAADVDNRE